MEFASLPPEILLQITSYLQHEYALTLEGSIFQLAQVNLVFRDLAIQSLCREDCASWDVQKWREATAWLEMAAVFSQHIKGQISQV